jgi:hypothetical protein
MKILKFNESKSNIDDILDKYFSKKEERNELDDLKDYDFKINYFPLHTQLSKNFDKETIYDINYSMLVVLKLSKSNDYEVKAISFKENILDIVLIKDKHVLNDIYDYLISNEFIEKKNHFERNFRFIGYNGMNDDGDENVEAFRYFVKININKDLSFKVEYDFSNWGEYKKGSKKEILMLKIDDNFQKLSNVYFGEYLPLYNRVLDTKEKFKDLMEFISKVEDINNKNQKIFNI